MAETWKLTVRDGPRVEHVRCDSLEEAVTQLRRRLDDLAPDTRRDDVQVLRRNFEASRQVAVRAEIRGPGGLLARPRGGVDLHGDGSVEAYTGRLRRTDVQLGPGEDAFGALRRALSALSGDGAAGEAGPPQGT